MCNPSTSVADIEPSHFFCSHDRNSPLPLTLGTGQVIKGWDEGLQGMCVNEKRKLTIPPNKAYGAQRLPIASTKPILMKFDRLTGIRQRHSPKLCSRIWRWTCWSRLEESRRTLMVYISGFLYSFWVPMFTDLISVPITGNWATCLLDCGSLIKLEFLLTCEVPLRTWALKLDARFLFVLNVQGLPPTPANYCGQLSSVSGHSTPHF